MATKIADGRNELLTAFGEKGYQTSVVGSLYAYISTDNSNYKKAKIEKSDVEIKSIDNIDKLVSLKELLYGTSMVARLKFILEPLIGKYRKYKFVSTDISESSADIYESFYGKSYQGNDLWYYDALTTIMNYPEPKLVIIHDVKSHFPFMYDEYGKRIKRNRKEENDPYNYPSQHYFAGKIVISYIDYILNRDPEAVIILQSDHGLHNDGNRRQLIFKYGKDDEDVRLMQNQTISAVRIPEKWGGLNQPMEPPNITRLLVNRYVGENYTLLSSDEIIK
jgi:hypothetical protein